MTFYPQSIEVYESWVERIKSGARLTKWEEDFIDSIADRLSMNRIITERQAEILERIYVEKAR